MNISRALAREGVPPEGSGAIARGLDRTTCLGRVARRTSDFAGRKSETTRNRRFHGQ